MSIEAGQEAGAFLFVVGARIFGRFQLNIDVIGDIFTSQDTKALCVTDIGDLCQYFFRHVKALVTIGVLRFRKLKAVNMVVTFFLYDFQWRDQVRMGKGLQKDFIACFEQVLRKRR